MFHIFKKKGEQKITDRVWISEEAKWNAVIEMAKQNPSTAFIAWFAETAEKAEALLKNENLFSGQVFLASHLNTLQLQNNAVVIVEHYPLHRKEEELFLNLHSSIIILSSLNEPLFHRFGGEKIIAMMKQLGMKETEAVEHSMLTKAIRNAQEKIEKKVGLEQSAGSQQEWLQKNLPA
jgi:hypothetical protein